jgi:hypothetical protein
MGSVLLLQPKDTICCRARDIAEYESGQPYLLIQVSEMPLPPSPLDWSKRLQYDWTSQEGLDRLNGIVGPSITYKPRHFQLYDSASRCILNGTDVVCMTATGDGKSALILFPALARKEMINIVIEPTNSLESDMVRDIGFSPNKRIFTVIRGI